MTDELRKINQYKKILEESRYSEKKDAEGITFCPCDYKTGNNPPAAESFLPFSNGGEWGTGMDSHAWFHLTVSGADENTVLSVTTNKNGWDASNPQFIGYVNGKMRQGMDTNHTVLRLDVGENDVYLYGYTGPAIPKVNLRP